MGRGLDTQSDESLDQPVKILISTTDFDQAVARQQATSLLIGSF